MTTVDVTERLTRFGSVAKRLGQPDLETLGAAFQLHEAAPGEALVSEMTHSDELFLVIDGTLDISVRGGAGEHHLATLASGSMFGDVALLEPGPAGATVSTSQGATVLRMSRERFDRLRRDRPAAAAALLDEVLRSLAARLSAARHHLEQIGPQSSAATTAVGQRNDKQPAGD
jgi:CRP-like cAMP-binding protein